MAKIAKKTMKRMVKRPKLTLPKRVSMKRMPQPSRLAACTAGYLRAVANPFTASDVCLPIGDALPSQKFSTRTRGSAFVGTSGVGFLLAQPTPANDRNAVHSSAANYALTSSTAIPALGSGGTNQGNFLDGPSTTALLAAASDTWKFVMLGLRVRYVGTENNLSGTVSLWEDNEDFQTIGMTPDSIRSKADVHTFPVSRKWTKIVLASGDSRLQNFSILPDYASIMTGGALGTMRYPVCAIFTGTSGNEYEFEVIHHFEFRSQGRASLYTRSTIDPIAGQAAVNGAENQPASGQGSFETLAINTLDNVRRGATVLGNGMSFFNSVANAITGYNQIAEPGSGQNVFGARTNFGRRSRGGFQIMDVD